MNRLACLIVFAIVVLASSAQSEDACKTLPAAKTAAKKTHESPFACDLAALTPQQRKRHFDELGPILKSLKTGVRELPDGYEFRYPSDPKTVALLAEWASQESLCCPFFDISLRLEPEHGPAWMRLTGRAGTKAFMKAEAPEWIQQ
ncbi:MAG TPA: hypothetical protein VEZ11_16990 [Thermoanaerobaculia bacterium]|nr:hypothetical protein [Thermoanaerobaculia bacterium]